MEYGNLKIIINSLLPMIKKWVYIFQNIKIWHMARKKYVSHSLQIEKNNVENERTKLLSYSNLHESRYFYCHK